MQPIRYSSLLLCLCLYGCTQPEPEIDTDADKAGKDDAEQTLLLEADLSKEKSEIDLMVSGAQVNLDEQSKLKAAAKRDADAQERALLEQARVREKSRQDELDNP